MDMAYMAATRATCPRRHVGAVLVKQRKLLGSAYNGAPSGAADCYEAGCMLVEHWEEEKGELIKKKHCVRTIHAEQNILLFTNREDRQEATIFVTDQPCWTCTNMLANSGITEIIYHRPYKKDQHKATGLLTAKQITFRRLEHYIVPEGLAMEVVD